MLDGISLGYFSPSSEFGDVAAVAQRIREIVGPTSEGFPFAVSPVQDEKGQTLISYGVIRGHVPIHIDQPNAAEACPMIFTFVVEAENRPVLLYVPAAQDITGVVLGMTDDLKARAPFGAIELVPGKAVQFDIARSFHGITSFPTGDPSPRLPEAVVVQVPCPKKGDIGWAVNRMMQTMHRDERFRDLTEAAREKLRKPDQIGGHNGVRRGHESPD